jgi:uncharacterized membrane protein HdeD (DUF308 family)
MQRRGTWIVLSIITGLLMIVLGGLFVASPGLSLATVILLFGIFAIVYGVGLALAGIMGHAESRGGAMAVGVLAVIVGIIALVWPELTSLTLLYIIAAWMIVSGVADIAGAFMGGVSGGQRVWLVILGLVSIVIGIVFFIHPVSGALALLWLVGIYLIVLGVLRIIAGFAKPPRTQAA